MWEEIINIITNISNKASQIGDLIQTSINSFKIIGTNIVSVLQVDNGLTSLFTPMIIMIYLSIVFIAIDLARDII